MIEVDGSMGEGGGQILRTSIALSAVTSQQVRVSRIRANRPNPGLSPQHVISIEAVARLCDAEVDGLFPGSKEIVFRPGQLLGGDLEFDVGTAGSISLMLQSCLIPAIKCKSDVKLRFRGGTDVKWSPPIDYMRYVHIPLLSRFGPQCNLETLARGFYPEGGGEVLVEISPVTALDKVDLQMRGEPLAIEGAVFAQNLPENVVTRMKHSALKTLLDFQHVRIETDLRRGRSTGAGIVLAAKCENSIIGASALGAKGVRAEALGEACARDLLETLRSGAALDEHMLDQILPYMALAGKGSVATAEEMTQHAETNIAVIEKFMGRLFSVDRQHELTEVATI